MQEISRSINFFRYIVTVWSGILAHRFWASLPLFKQVFTGYQWKRISESDLKILSRRHHQFGFPLLHTGDHHLDHAPREELAHGHTRFHMPLDPDPYDLPRPPVYKYSLDPHQRASQLVSILKPT